MLKFFTDHVHLIVVLQYQMFCQLYLVEAKFLLYVHELEPCRRLLHKLVVQ
jgi:hypothetical protein